MITKMLKQRIAKLEDLLELERNVSEQPESLSTTTLLLKVKSLTPRILADMFIVLGISEKQL